MQEAVQARTPVHLWIVGGLATLWNAYGAFDYTMTRTRNVDYLSQMPGISAEQMLAYVDSLPIWSQIGWGLGVWGGLAGSLLLLLRSGYAVHAFALSLIGVILSIGYELVAAPPAPAAMHEGMFAVMPYVIMAVAVALLLYARAMAAKGVLR